MSSMDLASQSLNPLPKTLLLPGNEEIQVLERTPSKLPPIVPPIDVPRTPRTPRRHLTVDELLRSPRTPIRKKKGTKKGKHECTRDERLRIHSYYNAKLTVKQIREKLPTLTKR